MEEYLIKIAYAGVIVVCFLIAASLRSQFSESQRKTLCIIIREGILFAQELYKQFDGEKRYQKALEYITRELKKVGIKISEDRLHDLIHAILKDVRKEFGILWYNDLAQ